MMPNDTTRWTVSVSRDTDIAVRSFLAQRGMKKGDLSKFIEEAVRWRVFHRTVQDIRARNADAGPDEIQRIVDEAIREVRADKRTRRKAYSG